MTERLLYMWKILNLSNIPKFTYDCSFSNPSEYLGVQVYQGIWHDSSARILPYPEPSPWVYNRAFFYPERLSPWDYNKLSLIPSNHQPEFTSVPSLIPNTLSRSIQVSIHLPWVYNFAKITIEPHPEFPSHRHHIVPITLKLSCPLSRVPVTLDLRLSFLYS